MTEPVANTVVFGNRGDPRALESWNGGLIAGRQWRIVMQHCAEAVWWQFWLDNMEPPVWVNVGRVVWLGATAI